MADDTCDCRRLLDPLAPSEHLPDHVCTETAQESVWRWATAAGREQGVLVRGHTWPLPVSERASTYLSQHVNRSAAYDANYRWRYPAAAGGIDWLALVVRVAAPSWQVTLHGEATRIGCDKPGLPWRSASSNPKQGVIVWEPGTEDAAGRRVYQFGWLDELGPFGGPMATPSGGVFRAAWQYGPCRADVDASGALPAAARDEVERLTRWYLRVVQRVAVGDRPGRALDPLDLADVLALCRQHRSRHGRPASHAELRAQLCSELGRCVGARQYFDLLKVLRDAHGITWGAIQRG